MADEQADVGVALDEPTCFGWTQKKWRTAAVD